ncbi:hypothetical protein, conserved [Eimeria acervulina]|uniref:Uncharacterized protein n=1 Tax=Eimeria acervulina TaxID=5801 RepID=U6GFT3_EIMAC|nr:hypothetical protein, conserved [Eimeria acervulina]CDI79091.1 hypothetical protein, conserved [Eimeria acervulina]
MSFLQDPLIEWRTSLSRHQQQQQQQQQQQRNEAAATKIGERKAFACIVAIQKKLQGCISVLPPGAFEESVHLSQQQQQQQQQQRRQQRGQTEDGNSSSEESFVESEGEEPSIPGAAGAAAVAAAAAAQSSSGTLGVYAQVAALIRSASSEENLSQIRSRRC